MSHRIQDLDNGKRSLYVDTAFLNEEVREHGLTIQHAGFGDFVADTPEGQVMFLRGDGFGLEKSLDWGDLSGRPHRVHGAGADWLLRQVEDKAKADAIFERIANDEGE